MRNETTGMKKVSGKSRVLWVLGAGVVIAGSAQLGAALAQDGQEGAGGAAAAGAADMMQDPAMQKWMELAQPGEHHEVLKKMVGTWNAKTKMWMDPSAPPMESTGTYEAKLLLGGRYLAGHYKGEAMGQPFEGIDIFGYDNLKKKFVDNWIDTMGTGFTYSEGTINEAGDVITMRGEMPNPMDDSMMYSRNVTRLVDANTIRIEMYHAFSKDGEYVKSMEIEYTRAK